MNTLNQHNDTTNFGEKVKYEGNISPIEQTLPIEETSPIEETPSIEETSTIEKTQFDEKSHPAEKPNVGIGTGELTLLRTGTSVAKNTKARLEEFAKLDRVIKTYASGFRKAGNALVKIIREQLWAVGYKTWTEYLDHLTCYGIVHIGRLVYAANFVNLVEEANKSNPQRKMPLPLSEWQIRAIPRKLDDNQKLAVWRIASEESDGEPKHDKIQSVRAMMFPNTMVTKPSKKKNKIFAAIKEVEALLDGSAPIEEIKSALNRLSRILKVENCDGDEPAGCEDIDNFPAQ